MNKNTDLQHRIAQACHVLAMMNQGDALLGHVSLRIGNTETFWMKAAGYGLEEITSEQVLCMDLEGQVYTSGMRRHREWPIHAEIYRLRPDIHAIVHTHALHACIFSTLSCSFQPLSYEGALFVPDNLARFECTAQLITSPPLGREVAQTLGNGSAILLRNHGLITVGSTLEEACMLAIHLEKACQIQMMALQTGTLYTELQPEEVREEQRTYQETGLAESLWSYYVRKTEKIC